MFLYEFEANLAGVEKTLIDAQNNYALSKISLAQLLLLDDYQNFDIADKEYELQVSNILDKSPEEIFAVAVSTKNEIKLFETSEEIVPLRKTSRTIGKCCQLGKAMSKLTGGMSDVYLTQSELNEDGSYTVFFVSAFMIGFDTELTQYGVENPTAKISSFHLKDEDKFNRLQEFVGNPVREDVNIFLPLSFRNSLKTPLYKWCS